MTKDDIWNIIVQSKEKIIWEVAIDFIHFPGHINILVHSKYLQYYFSLVVCQASFPPKFNKLNTHFYGLIPIWPNEY